ncbi:MAG: helix-hairpin-helix domain-containing protein [Wenzhouxiangella sp.]|nr:MAG: helix-hairpin-helix domain-containing protein [Wenzhouxiangella sp.]
MIKNIIFAMLLSLALTGLTVADMEPVDINTANAEQLADALHGVGAAKAEAIIAYREENGPFAHIDELVNVRGIGLGTVDRNRDRISLGQTDSD